ncbi:hypothetical protein E6C27_scaffold55G002200 [Cucumis melo var. makuwa]|uniref:DNA-directed RNA polymerase I subunit RPA1-like n=1 Tax=Cucumis melo var. makuwa TaxID=1194695 RepID=A0A5A7UDD6_CUCMM|nr:hypothetical protein E6C27_scaffold55G002200 [Cucumis melo var. makuwa]
MPMNNGHVVEDVIDLGNSVRMKSKDEGRCVTPRSSSTFQYVVKHWSGCGSWNLDGDGHTRLICASFGSTRLICASFGSTRLICASFGSTRLICASFGSTRLLCRVGVQRGADRRGAGRMREGHMDASGFLIASAIDLSLVRKVGSLQDEDEVKK